MSRYALHNSYFSSVVRQRFQVIGQGASKRYLKNTNKLLWQYPGCIGVKTGTTIAAGPCLVSAAENGRGKKYLCAVLNSPDRYGDSKKLLEYGFKNFTTITLFHQGDLIRLVKVNNGVKKNVAAEVPFDETISLSQNQSHSLKKIYLIKDQVIAPIKKGQSLGQIKILDKDQRLISRINVVAHESIAENLNWWATFKKNFPFDKIKEFFHLHRNLNS